MNNESFDDHVAVVDSEKKEKSAAERAASLIAFGAEHGNLVIKIIDEGSNLGKIPVLKSSLLHTPDSELLDEAVHRSLTFVNAPTFTDNSVDHYARRDWEDEFLKFADKEVFDYYESNCLGKNNINLLLSLCSYLDDNDCTIDPNTKSKIKALEAEFKTMIPSTPYYLNLDDQAKVALIPSLKQIYRSIISILTENRE
jgi:hypothetical protein